MGDTKTCSACKEIKAITEFNKDKSTGDGLRRACRDCTKKAYKRWSSSASGKEKKKIYDKNRNTEYIRKKNKRWRECNRDRHIQSVRRWRERNPEKTKEYEKRRASRAEWYRKKRRDDLNYRVACSLRTRLNAAVKAQLKGSCIKKGSAVENLGCSMSEFLEHLESLFQGGMSWENYGEWHIDHKRPLSVFNLDDEEQVKIACHYSNLQPLWAGDNLSKGNR